MDIKKSDVEQIEKKTLGEDCWITLGDVKIKVDYLTRAQEMEFNRLVLMWENKHGDQAHSHHLEYYFRCAVKDIQGITIEGKEATLTFKNGMAQELVSGESRLDIIACFLELKLFMLATGMIIEKLQISEADKKKLQSAQDSVKTENLQEPENDSTAEKSSIPGRIKEFIAGHSKK